MSSYGIQESVLEKGSFRSIPEKITWELADEEWCSGKKVWPVQEPRGTMASEKSGLEHRVCVCDLGAGERRQRQGSGKGGAAGVGRSQRKQSVEGCVRHFDRSVSWPTHVSPYAELPPAPHPGMG